MNATWSNGRTPTSTVFLSILSILISLLLDLPVFVFVHCVFFLLQISIKFYLQSVSEDYSSSLVLTIIYKTALCVRGMG